MSHILDALRRADEERHLGKTPGVGIIVQPVRRPPERERNGNAVIIGLLGAVILLLIAVVIWRWPSASPVAAPGSAPETPAPRTALAESPRTERATADLPAAPRARIDSPTRLRSFDDVLPPPPAPSPTPAAPRTTELSPRDIASPVATSPAAPAPTVRAGSELPAPEGPAVRNLADMPDSYRADFPRFEIGVHVYNADPARRFILVGAQRYNEGSTLSEGPVLESIQETGVVMSWRGQTVRLPVR
jgi:general secretion pathway protein B